MTFNERAARKAEIAVKMALNEKLYKNSIITKTMFEHARVQLLKG